MNSMGADNAEIVLELKDVYHAYDQHLVVKGLSFQLRKGEIGCLLGSSGCGKTTILRAIAGFEGLVEGEISLKGRVVSGKGNMVPADKRQVGMVFQDYALFPHLTIYDNVAFGLRNMEKSKRLLRVDEALETVGLAGDAWKYPHELSGGQQQRVALARALVPKPDLLLMDEPFSNLDVTLREKLATEVRDILKAYGATALFVTHNQYEAFAIADTVGVMHGGEIQQWDSPQNLYHMPVNRFVAGFVGKGMFLPGVILSKNEVRTGLGVLKGDINYPCEKDCPVDVLVRPEDIVHIDESPVQAEIVDKTFRGASIMYTLLLESGERVLSLALSHHDHPIGMKIGIQPEVDHIIVFDRQESTSTDSA